MQGREIGAQVFAKQYKLLNPEASNEDLIYEENRLERASIVIAVVYTPVRHSKIPMWEMELSSGAVCSNLLIAAQSLGYAAQWLTEWYSYNEEVLREFGGDPETDKIAGFIYIWKQAERTCRKKKANKKQNNKLYIQIILNCFLFKTLFKNVLVYITARGNNKYVFIFYTDFISNSCS